MKIHFHDWGLWSDVHTAELHQFRACKTCGKIVFRSIGGWIFGNVDVALANATRAQALSDAK